MSTNISVADWWKQFYALSDNGVAHEEYSQLYAPNAKLIMGDNEVNGRDGRFTKLSDEAYSNLLSPRDCNPPPSNVGKGFHSQAHI
jgi:hypothetical protein